MPQIYHCGPLQVLVVSDPFGLEPHLRNSLNLFSPHWEKTETVLELCLTRPEPLVAPTAPVYLRAVRMQVWLTSQELIAICDSGATARLHIERGRWVIGIPTTTDDIWTITDIENLVSLVLTTGWRNLGWVPFHAGLVCRHSSLAAMLCAPSGGGKTTLTLALVKRGWSTLGDDKLLLRRIPGDSAIEARALVHTFNLFPHTRQWFPALGDISALPRYSAWTEKRRVPVCRLHANAPRTCAYPSHLLQVVRSDEHRVIKVSPMNYDAILSLLLRQTVIPNHRNTASTILAIVAMLARNITGLHVEVGKDAYFDPDCLTKLEACLGT